MKKKIAVFQNRPGIGDMCIFLPLIHLISKHYSEPVYLFTKSRSKSKELLKYDPNIFEIIYIDEVFKNKNFFSRISYLKNFKLDKVYLFTYGVKYPFLFKLSKVKDIFFYGFFKKKNNIFSDAKFFLNKFIEINKHEISCKLFLNESKNRQQEKKLNSCVIGIGGSGPQKKWSIKNYSLLITELEKKGIEKFIIAGGNDEIGDFMKLSNLLKGKKLISLCEKSLEDSIKEISKANMYIGNDTGFMHISGMCGLKTFGLFGDTPTNYVSYNPNIKAIIPDGYDEIWHNSKAMNKITVEKIIREIFLN